MYHTFLYFDSFCIVTLHTSIKILIMVNKIIFIFLLIGFVVVEAQNPAIKEHDAKQMNYVSRDERVDILQDAHRKFNQQAGMNGFRIQIYTDSES